MRRDMQSEKFLPPREGSRWGPMHPGADDVRLVRRRCEQTVALPRQQSRLRKPRSDDQASPVNQVIVESIPAS